MKTGLELIAEERQRQIDEECFNAEHDKQHKDGSLAVVAACYATPKKLRQFKEDVESIDTSCRGECPVWRPKNFRLPTLWPESWSYTHWKQARRIKELVKAGALIAAEIDRIQDKRRRR